MRGARRRPYVDMVKPCNEADARPGHNPKGRGDLGAFLRREPLQYRHIAAGSPPLTASHIASVAHVLIIEIGSSGRPRFKSVGRYQSLSSSSIRWSGALLTRRMQVQGLPGQPAQWRSWCNSSTAECESAGAGATPADHPTAGSCHISYDSSRRRRRKEKTNSS